MIVDQQVVWYNSNMEYEHRPMHPVEHLAFWQTKKEEVDQMAKLYDQLAVDPAQKQALDKLIAWAREERSCKDCYNNSDG